MSSQSKRSRLLIIHRIRQEAEQAAQEGKSVHSCPREYIGTSNEMQWKAAYELEKACIAQREEDTNDNKRTD